MMLKLPLSEYLPNEYGNILIPCSSFTFHELAEIYNKTRVDYIVPMPMNGKRMVEYVNHYDVDLEHSLVSIASEDQQPNGLCMVAVRGNRSWITRLGVNPLSRRHKAGESMMRRLIQMSKDKGLAKIQLEVIVGNEPAYHLFQKLGFVTLRQLMILRRPPAPVSHSIQTYHNDVIDDDNQIRQILELRADTPAWTEENVSLLNGGNLKAILLQFDSGETGWIVFQRTPFQLLHFVFSAHPSYEMSIALLQAVHNLYAMQDTKLENIALDCPLYTCGAFDALGYVEAFRRYEMVLNL
jgi:GNAT superfamily N-acetyltransferase